MFLNRFQGPLVCIWHAKQRSSMYLSISSSATSKGIVARPWTSFYRTNCFWCNSWITIWPCTIHSGRSRDFLSTSKRGARSQILIVCEQESRNSLNEHSSPMRVYCLLRRSWHWRPSCMRPVKSKKIWTVMSLKRYSMKLKISYPFSSKPFEVCVFDLSNFIYIQNYWLSSAMQRSGRWRKKWKSHNENASSLSRRNWMRVVTRKITQTVPCEFIFRV